MLHGSAPDLPFMLDEVFMNLRIVWPCHIYYK